MTEDKREYTVLNVQVQKPFEEWEEKEFTKKDGTTFTRKVEPAGISLKEIEGKNGTNFYKVTVPHNVEIDGKKIGGSHYFVPSNAVREIEPDHEKASDWEKKADPEKTKKIILGNDFELSFSYDNYDKEEGKIYNYVGTATVGEYKKALSKRNTSFKKAPSVKERAINVAKGKHTKGKDISR